MILLVGVGIAAAAVAHTAAAAGWSIYSAPRPVHADDTDLLGVSCVSTRDCTAVGSWDLATSLEPIPLVEHWNGSRWSIVRTPIPTASGWSAWLSAVSCTSSRACMAVGSSYNNATGTAPLAERWNGSAWSIQRTPRPSGIGEFDDVSCASSAACIAVGGGQESFAQRWDGRRWTTENLHFSDPQGRVNALVGVSCPSMGTCAAVGWDDVGLCSDPYESDYAVAVLGLWSSGRWSLGRQPDLACSRSSDNGGGIGLNAVSCTSSVACTAVGTGVYRWDGRRWSNQPAPNGSDELLGVSCTSSTACTAVGSHGYTWNGRAWSSSPISRPPRAKKFALDSVSCPSPGACFAVGGWEDSRATDHMVVESIGIGSGR